MGAAAYNRASRVICQRIDADFHQPDKTINLDENHLEFQAARIRELEAEVTRLRQELSRARRLIRALQAGKALLLSEKSALREKAVRVKQYFLSKGSHAHCYGAIICAKRLGLM